LTSSVIDLKQVSKSYGNLTAVDEVSLSVNAGDLLVLLGSSGCGKTTTLRLVAGLEQPDSGEVWLDGRPVASNSTWVQPEDRHIGMVFQDYALFPHLNVQQNIEFALEAVPRRKNRRHRVSEMLSLVGLEGLGSRFPHQLSGGQQQRVALARALAAEPAVVLLDEPFSNLDAALRKTMREEVRRILQAANATAIFVTHDQEEAMSLADQIAVIQGGKLLQVGRPGDLYRCPNSLDVAMFLGEVNLISGHANGPSVETVLGTLPLSRSILGDVEVMIRPEAMTLMPDPDGPAHITDVRFFGYYQLLTVVQGGHEFEVRTWAQADYTVGQQVRLGVEGNVVAFA
jgi:iron(III) transport system ATP-binding protein